ncbi:hypothetical protein HV824_01875 [Myxococcus sp. AM009]|uniref:hypothetical protein n=1 Tax=unclassified Myxococcus TaxID=2648731 RepID=UPI0015957920|nr:MULTISPECIES: hypothetical protein [unclassified Myxococcus]NVI96873.1 hypothetical protein [Myxococcus sp. AM009]NVJ13942.1 hypothetical protein [Myxococcus sp. AM010]
MKTSLRAFAVTSSLALAFSGGCSGSDGPPPSTTDDAYTDLPEAKTTVSGIAFDPEAFFFSLATFPVMDPEMPPPPPFLFENIPYVFRSAPVGARVSVVRNGESLDSSGPVAPNGLWQVRGVPSGNETAYKLRVEPPLEGLVMGAPEMFPAPPFEPIPEATYFPTSTLRPFTAGPSSCLVQVAGVVGDAGALAAVATLRTDMGIPTTPADLVDPTRTGGVALIWVYAPSEAFDLFNIPADSIAAETSAGSLYAIEWAPPGFFPGQSPMGYFATPAPTSSLGYFAVVLPPGTTEPVTVSFVDEGTSPPEEQNPFLIRPWNISPLTLTPEAGVGFARVLSVPSVTPPFDPDAEPVPEPDLGWMCR